MYRYSHFFNGLRAKQSNCCPSVREEPLGNSMSPEAEDWVITPPPGKITWTRPFKETKELDETIIPNVTFI